MDYASRFGLLYTDTTSRQEWGSATFLINENTTTFLSDITDRFLAETEPLRDIDGVIMTLVLQPINTDEIKIFSKNGGNCLGFRPDEGPFLCMSPLQAGDMKVWRAIQY